MQQGTVEESVYQIQQAVCVAHATGIDESLYMALQALMQAHVDAVQRASISSEEWHVDGVCVVRRAGHNTVCIGSTRSPACRLDVAKVSESDAGFYIGVSCTESSKLQYDWVLCALLYNEGRWRCIWVNIQHNQSLTELCICTAQVGLRKQGEGRTDTPAYAVCQGQIVFCWY